MTYIPPDNRIVVYGTREKDVFFEHAFHAPILVKRKGFESQISILEDQLKADEEHIRKKKISIKKKRLCIRRTLYEKKKWEKKLKDALETEYKYVDIFTEIPQDLRLMILYLMDWKTIKIMAQVCWQWRIIIWDLAHQVFKGKGSGPLFSKCSCKMTSAMLKHFSDPSAIPFPMHTRAMRVHTTTTETIQLPRGLNMFFIGNAPLGLHSMDLNGARYLTFRFSVAKKKQRTKRFIAHNFFSGCEKVETAIFINAFLNNKSLKRFTGLETCIFFLCNISFLSIPSSVKRVLFIGCNVDMDSEKPFSGMEHLFSVTSIFRNDVYRRVYSNNTEEQKTVLSLQFPSLRILDIAQETLMTGTKRNYLMSESVLDDGGCSYPLEHENMERFAKRVQIFLEGTQMGLRIFLKPKNGDLMVDPFCQEK